MRIAQNKKLKLMYLNHPRMIPDIIPRPWSPVLHCPPFFWDLLGLGNQSIDSNFKLFILSLQYELSKKIEHMFVKE
jgi:hypothetical protein